MCNKDNRGIPNDKEKLESHCIYSISINSFCCCNVVLDIEGFLFPASRGEVLSSSSADTLRYPASLTKVMTLYITFGALKEGILKLDDQLPVSRQAANRSPSKLGLRAGSTIDVKTCIMAVIVKSANDCATVLAEGLGYSEENFAQSREKGRRPLDEGAII